MSDLAAEIARALAWRFPAGRVVSRETAYASIAENWPDAQYDDATRAVAIWEEITTADEAFELYGRQPRFGEPPRA